MRRVGVVLVVVALVTGAAACSSSGSDGASNRSRTNPDTHGAPTDAGPTASNEVAGLLPAATWRTRQDAFLAFAAAQPLSPGRPLSLIARAEEAKRTGKDADLKGVKVSDFKDMFEKLETYQDTGDFDINELLTLWIRYRSDLDPKVADAIEERILAFKYWWTEPTPKGVIDSQYYWTENHQIIYLANELVAGETFPKATFTNSGMTGAEHVAHAESHLQTWFTSRARFGFSEWLSNVYMSEDLKGLLLIAEEAKDPKLAREASMFVDLLLVELAGHVEKGTFGATHGRSYQKDKLAGPDEDTFSTAKLVFDDTPGPYVNADNATLFAVAARYRPPVVAEQIAKASDTGVFRLRAGIPLDPTAPVDPKVKAPYGLSFTGEDGLMTWWGMGGQFPWQVAPLSVETVKKYDLFKTTNFKQASSLEGVVATADDATIRNLAQSLAKQVNPGLVSQVDAYTYRSPNVMLSTAEDWRPGQRGEQDHISQATIDQDALVFTQHPRDGVPTAEDPNANEGYWTGDGAMPRSGQVQNVAISIYAPQYDGGGGVGTGAYSFSYEPYTHAYFPTEKFDQVVQRDGWTIGRKGDGYIALWSERPTTWRQHGPADFTHGLTKDFDLVAEGGPDDVWITEVGNASDYESFDAFVAAITASKPTVAVGAHQGGAGSDDGATVTYDSPSQGPITYGWQPKAGTDALPPLTVKGKPVDLHPTEKAWDSPWATADWDSQRYHAEAGGATLDLDFTKVTRKTSR